jgi:hypothetical protein|tara:strand:+ start:1323 stop:2111 length:789 start_codon:yes stop_codon:yes gene_type:complete
MIEKLIRESFQKYLKVAEIESNESNMPYYINQRNIVPEKVDFFQFLHLISVDKEFRNKWWKTAPLFGGLKDNSLIQQDSLMKIIIGILNDPNLKDLNQHGKKGQVLYLFGNAVASYSNYNHYYLISKEALLVLKNNDIDVSSPVTRSKIFDIRHNRKKLLTFEHMCPSSQLIKLLIELRENHESGKNKSSNLSLNEKILEKFYDYGLVCIITKDEDMGLKGKLRTDLSFSSKTSTSNMLDRYEKANIELANTLIPVYGKMYR